MFFSIHDHTNSHCFVKVLQGNLLETCYAWPKDDEESVDGTPMIQIGSTTYEVNGVTYISGNVQFFLK